MKTAYNPIKVFHPGETLSEKLNEMEMTVAEFATQAGVPVFVVEAIIAGNMSITAELAMAFEQVTQIPAHYWLNAQHSYDEYLLQHIANTFRDRLMESQEQLATSIVHSVIYASKTPHYAYA